MELVAPAVFIAVGCYLFIKAEEPVTQVRRASDSLCILQGLLRYLFQRCEGTGFSFLHRPSLFFQVFDSVVERLWPSESRNVIFLEMRRIVFAGGDGGRVSHEGCRGRLT